MKRMLSAPLAICVLLSLMVASSMISGCGSGNGNAISGGTTRDAPPQLLGMWQLVRTSGGIMGGGYPVTPGMETLIFNNNGRFVRTVSGHVTRGTYQVTVRQTPFGDSKLPVITYSSTTLNDVITQVGDQPLVLSEEAADGYLREYERVVTTGK